jgi:hypothetical protein
MEHSEDVVSIITDYQQGFISSIELIDQIRFLAAVSENSAKFSQVHFIQSNGIYFVIQSGICHQILSNGLKINKL